MCAMRHRLAISSLSESFDEESSSSSSQAIYALLALGHPPLGLRYDFPLALVRFGHSLLMCRIFNKNFLSVQSMSLNQENSNILLINSNAKTRLESSNKTFNLLIESI
ncbi:hypothetical protein QL285_089010 [Trifolium repens]|nr:hypothetical protein QL285_089010 [Trifolium repens]